MAKPFIPSVKPGSYMANPRKGYIPFVGRGGYTKQNHVWPPEPDPIWETVKGNPVSFETIKQWPLKKLEVAFSPVQTGTGDPSPDNVRPISGWDSLNVEQRGKNLYNYENLYSGYFSPSFNGTGAAVDYATAAASTNRQWTFVKIPVEAGDTITISGTQARGGVYSAFTGDDPSDVVQSFLNANANSKKTVPANAKYLCLALQIGWTDQPKTDFPNAQVEIGSTATEYVPYTGRSISITLGQTVYSGTLDVVTGVGTVTHKKVVLDASYTNIQIRNTYVTDGVRRFNSWGFAYTGDKEWFKGTNESALYCDTLKPQFDAVRQAGCIWITGGQAPSYSSGFALTLTDQTIETPAEADAYMAAHPITIVAELRYPFEIQLTPQEVNSIAGDNTMWSNANQPITVTYRSN